MDEYSSVYQIPVFQYVLEFFRKLIDLSIYQIFTHAHTIEIFDDSQLLYRNASILLKVTIIHFLPPPLPSIFDVYQVQASSTDLQVVGSKPG